jgi:hypothetical protein
MRYYPCATAMPKEKPKRKVIKAADLLLLNHTRQDHALLELPLVLALDAMSDSIEHCLDNSRRLKTRRGAFLVDTSLDEDGVPVSVFGVCVVLVRSTDVGLWGVSDEVDCFGRRINPMRIFPPLLEQAGGKLEGAELGFAEGGRLQFPAGDCLEHGLERHTKGAHADAGKVMRSTPDDVVVREEDWWTFIEVGAPRAETAVL